jgi:transglutaminase-like putative cysteine protease
MRIKVRHETHYSYQEAPRYVLQRLHLTPAAFASQKMLAWNIMAPGIEKALTYVDGMGNTVVVVTSSVRSQSTSITAEGEVETHDTAGVVRGLATHVPEAVFLRVSPATACSEDMKALAKTFTGTASLLERLHAMMASVHGRIAYETGTSDAHTTAAEAFADARGVCQDHAHVMVALARQLGIPARYVTGYLVTGQGASSTAAHAWAEIFVADLGWVGFDAANGQCPTEQYVRVAAGIDAAAVSPIRGFRRGVAGPENMRVEVRVEIAQQ